MSLKPLKMTKLAKEINELISEQYSQTLEKNLETLLDHEREIVKSDEGMLFLLRVYGKNENDIEWTKATDVLEKYKPRAILFSFLKSGIIYIIGGDFIGLTAEGRFYLERDINEKLSKSDKVNIEMDHYGRISAKLYEKHGIVDKDAKFRLISHPVFKDKETGRYISREKAFHALYPRN